MTKLLTENKEIYVQQKKEWAQIIIDWETANRYSVMDAHKKELAMIAERGSGFLKTLSRLFLRTHRPLEVGVFLSDGSQVFHFARKFFWFFSDLFVRDASGKSLGSVHRRFGILYKHYDLLDENGRVFARIESPLWRLWTFPVKDLSNENRAEISKKWSGGLQEVFTDADTFRIDFGTYHWTPSQRAVIFAAAISIDFDFFESNQGVSGLLDLTGD